MLARDVASSPLSLDAPSVGQLSAPTPLPRQLDDSEISALVTATADDSRLAVVALLTGVSVEELVALRWDAIDLSGDVIRLGSEDARVIPLIEPLRGLLISRRDRAPQGTAMVLSDRQGAPLAVEEIGRLVLYGAYDGALDRPDEVTPAALRYTFLSHLLRQGIRAADISAVAGRVNHNDMVVLMQRNSPSVRRPMDQIDRLLPALREIAGGGTA
jgi:integrase